MSDLLQEARRLGDIADKLLFEVGRLARDVRTLSGRIAPFDDEARRVVPSLGRGPPRSFAAMFEQIALARLTIADAERGVNAIRATLDVIENDVHAREELKRWIIAPSRRRPKT